MERSRRVLVTRARQQGSELADNLRALGLEPVLIPAIEIVDPSSFAELDSALAALDHFDWLIFTSANAVEAFARRLTPAAIPHRPKVAAIGGATARALEAIGWKVDLLPDRAVAESFAQALLPNARRADGRPGTFLLIRADDARDVLPETLRQAGAEVVIAPAYRNVVPRESVVAIQRLFRTSAEDAEAEIAAITFTSSSTARNLVALCEAAGVLLPERARRISIGPITSQTLRELGLPPHAEAAETTVRALAQTVAEVVARN